MSGLRAQGGRSGSPADGHAAAAACLGVFLLAGTALSSALSSGPPFPAVVLPEAVAERGDGARGAGGPAPAAGLAPAGRPAATRDASQELRLPGPLNLNRADATDLQALPGIGPALAGRIVAHRQTHGRFRNAADLLTVPGIGAKRYARLRGLVCTADAP